MPRASLHHDGAGLVGGHSFVFRAGPSVGVRSIYAAHHNSSSAVSGAPLSFDPGGGWMKGKNHAGKSDHPDRKAEREKRERREKRATVLFGLGSRLCHGKKCLPHTSASSS